MLWSENSTSNFTKIRSKLAQDISKTKNYEPTKKLQHNKLFYLTPAHIIEIANIVSSMKNHKATGHDGIKIETLKIPTRFQCNDCTNTQTWWQGTSVKLQAHFSDKFLGKNIWERNPQTPFTLYSKWKIAFRKLVPTDLEQESLWCNKIDDWHNIQIALDQNMIPLCIILNLTIANNTVNYTQLKNFIYSIREWSFNSSPIILQIEDKQ